MLFTGTRISNSRGNWGIAALFIVLTAPLSSIAGNLPPDFSIVPILQGSLNKPISVCFLPAQLPPGDQRLFMLLAEQDGRVLFQQYAGQSPVVVLQLTDIGAGIGELGLLGITADPNFDVNNASAADNYVYLFYTEAAPPNFGCHETCTTCNRGHISRFRLDLNPPLLHSEETIWTGEWYPTCSSQGYHWAGDLHFVDANTLFFSTGDHFYQQQAQVPTSELGKMMRLDRADFGVGSAQVWSTGLRNPFRFNVDTTAPGTLYIGNVGSNGECSQTAIWEELNVASAATAGLNFGWPCAEGPSTNCPCNSYASIPECVSFGCTGFTDPFWMYDHTVGNCIIAGPVYRGSRYPSEYVNSVFVADYIRGWVKRIPISSNPATPIDFFVGELSSAIVDLEMGPLDSVYVVLRTPFQSMPAGVYRFGYREPAATFRYRQLSPFNDPDDRRYVMFNGSVKYNMLDFPNAVVTYSWDFGDGATSALQNPQHTYADRREYIVRLTAQIQSLGQPVWNVPATSIEIATGLRPTIQLTAPSAGTVYYANCPTAYAASAVDGLGNPVTVFHWRAEWVHDEHVHLISNLPDGGSGEFYAPTAPPAGHPEPLPFQFVVEAVDARDISNEATSPAVVFSDSHSITLNARPVETDFDVQLDGENLQFTTPSIVAGAEGTPIIVVAPSQTASPSGTVYEFRCWIDTGSTNPVRTGTISEDYASWTAHYTIASVSSCTVADTDGDGCVGLTELAQVLGAFGTSCCVNGNAANYEPDCDFNGDCQIDLTDLATVLSYFGSCP